ncbi:MAG TPA: DUF4230 domain-containing protein [Aggregatilineales bacterium]|nr:DUF4230 domain-containing protein [Aggregatilineales bacterium]
MSTENTPPRGTPVPGTSVPAAPAPVPPRAQGCFRPACLAMLLIILITIVVLGGLLVLVMRQVIPPDLTTAIVNAISGQNGQVTVKATSVLDRIQGMSELTTTRYNYSSLVTSERDMPDVLKALYGDKEILVAVGYVTAGIDLKDIHAADIVQSGGTLTIQLPPARLQACFLNEKDSYVVTRDTGVFSRPAPNLDQEARRYAVHQFRDMALKGDILSTVQTNAQNLIRSFVGTLNMPGVQTIQVNSAPGDSNTLPDSCQ